MMLKQGFWVVVADGARATIFVNEGTAIEPRLQRVRSYAQENPKTSAQGEDKPGRAFDSASNRRSAMEAPDLHQKAEDRFVDAIMVDLAKDAADNAFEHVIIAAPPVALGEMRKAVDPQLQSRIALWIDKDLTKEPIPKITDTVVRALEG